MATAFTRWIAKPDRSVGIADVSPGLVRKRPIPFPVPTPFRLDLNRMESTSKLRVQPILGLEATSHPATRV